MKHVNEILRDESGRAIGKGFSMHDIRDKINEIVDYINNHEEQRSKYWRPSEEQMEALFDAIVPDRECDCDLLMSLYDDLKTL